MDSPPVKLTGGLFLSPPGVAEGILLGSFVGFPLSSPPIDRNRQ
ncbi:hypothetical protein HMPREF9374_2709 [Desmospora sp. 8437]|nr:hypothetical protein HMPREF9374_2709 [Desmospora sp. 8437]